MEVGWWWRWISNYGGYSGCFGCGLRVYCLMVDGYDGFLGICSLGCYFVVGGCIECIKICVFFFYVICRFVFFLIFVFYEMLCCM